MAWVFELTPEGLKRDAEGSPAESITAQTARRMDRMIVVVLLLALGCFPYRRVLAGTGPDGKNGAPDGCTRRADGTERCPA